MTMKLIRAALLALSALAAAEPAFAQAPSPVPALPDTERRVQYSPSATTGPFAISFALFGTGTDYGNWIEVWLNGVRLTPVTDFTVTLTSGTLAASARPLTNAQVTLTASATGTLQIVGAERPRRLTQFAENAGVSARNLNVAITDLVAMMREVWDKINDVTGRVFMAPPGETLNVLPRAATRANLMPCFDSGGQLITCTPLATGLPVVAGQGISVSGSTLSTTAGVDTNILAGGAVITVAPTVDSSYCGKTAALGGAAQYAFVVGAASGFTANCSILVSNLDTTRGKVMTINGITFPQLGILWPSQTFELKNINNVWTVVGLPPAWTITAPVTFNIDTATGVDGSNDCLGALGTAGACRSLANATGLFCQIALVINTQVTFQTKTGQTHPSQGLCNYRSADLSINNNVPTIVGDTTSCALAANYVIDGVASPGLQPVGVSTAWIVKGMAITSSVNGKAVNADNHSILFLGKNIVFQAVSGFHVVSSFDSFVEFVDDYCITGSAVVHSGSNSGGKILIQPGHTITLTGTPAFTFFAQATLNSFQEWASTTFVGAATGSRFSATTGGGIDTNGGKVAVVTFNPATDEVNWTAHGLFANEQVYFVATPAAPLVSGTIYFVKTVTSANAFTLSATAGGALIDLTTAGTGINDGVAPYSLLPGSTSGSTANPGWFQ